MAEGPQAALAIVDRLAHEPALRGYHLLPSVRGDLLHKLGRYQEAVQDLEFALPLLPDPSRIHQGLAEAYRRQGLKVLAEQHERLAAGDEVSLPDRSANSP